MSSNAPDTPHMKMMMQQMLSTPNVQAIARLINEPEAKARTAISTALPVLIAALGQEAATPEGADQLAAALDKDHDGSILNELDNYVVSGGDVTQGRRILKHVLGDRQAHIEKQLAAAAKVDVVDMGNVMAGLAPVIMGALAADMRESNLGSRGLADMLLGGNSPIASLLGGSQGGAQAGGGLAGVIGGAVGSALLGSLLGGGSSNQGGGDLLGSLLGSVLGGGQAPQAQQGGGDLMGALMGGLLGGGAQSGGQSGGGQSAGGDLMGALLGGLMGGGDSSPTHTPRGGNPLPISSGSLTDMIAGMNTSGSSAKPKPAAPKPAAPKPAGAKPKPGAQQTDDDPSAMLGSLLTGLLTGGGKSASVPTSGKGGGTGSASAGASSGTDLSDFISNMNTKKK